MKDSFEAKVRAAAYAGWWTFGVGYVLVWLSYLLFRYAATAQPAWMMSSFGPGQEWSGVMPYWAFGLIAFKLVVGAILLASLWLTLWARRLRHELESRVGEPLPDARAGRVIPSGPTTSPA